MTTLCYFNCANDTIGKPVPDDEKGGYGAALESLCALLGCTDKVAQYITDDASESPPTVVGWVVVGDGEGDDYVYFDGVQQAHVQWSARGFWQAVATLHDGRVLHSKGGNLDMTFDNWG